MKIDDEIKIAFKSTGVKMPEDNEPCVRCGKVVRSDYKGFCMDCADELGLNEFSYHTAEQIAKIIEDDRKEVEWFSQSGNAWGPPPFFAVSAQQTGGGRTQ